jgi:hypothetical protein
MAWPGKVEAEELIGLTKEALGKKLEEINGALAQAAEAKTAATAAGVEVTAIKEQMALLEGRIATAATVKATSTNGNSTENTELPRWDENADAAFEARLSRVVGPIVSATVQNQSRFIISDVSQRMIAKDSRYKLVEDIARRLIANQPPALQVREDIVENCFKVALADNISAIETDRAAKTGKFYTESSVNGGQGPTEDIRPLEDRLSVREKEIAGKMGLTLKAYADAKATLNVVGV